MHVALNAIIVLTPQLVHHVHQAIIYILQVAFIYAQAEQDKIIQPAFVTLVQFLLAISAQTMPRYAPNATQGYR